MWRLGFAVLAGFALSECSSLLILTTSFNNETRVWNSRLTGVTSSWSAGRLVGVVQFSYWIDDVVWSRDGGGSVLSGLSVECRNFRGICIPNLGCDMWQPVHVMDRYITRVLSWCWSGYGCILPSAETSSGVYLFLAHHPWYMGCWRWSVRRSKIFSTEGRSPSLWGGWINR